MAAVILVRALKADHAIGTWRAQVETVSESQGMPDSSDLLRNGFRLGEWQVHPIEGMIEGPAGTHHLQPKSMDVLLCLAGTPNHIVERDDLIERVWGRTAVTDEPLTRCIHEIRRELNDAPDHPTFIQTVPKRGYRLIAPVDPESPSGADARAGGRGFPLRGLVLSKYGWGLIAVTALVAGLAGIVPGMRPAAPGVPLVRDLSNIAVIPFETRGDDQSLDWLGSGIAEDLLNLLSGVAGLEVAARASSFDRFPASLDVIEIGRDLKVHYVLKGSVQRTNDQLRIHARLVDAQTRFRLWSANYDRRAEELFAIQQDIARQVVAALKLAMPVDFRDPQSPLPGAVLPTTTPPTASIMAYDYYLQARNLLQAPVSPASLDQAAEFFTRAIDHDAGFAGAYTGLCATIVKQMEIRKFELRPTAELIDPADTVCRKAIELGPESVDSHAAYGELYRATGRPQKAIEEYSWIIKHQPRTVDAYLGIGSVYADIGADVEAERAYQTAIRIKPDYARAYQAYGAFLSNQGRYREVVEIGRRLVQLDPQSVTGYVALGNASFISGQFTAAIAAYREVVRREPTASAYVEIGASLYYLGRYRAAAQTYRLAEELDPLEHGTWGGLGDVYLQVGGSSQQAMEAYYIARGLAEDQLERAPADPVTRIALAYYCAALGDGNCAVEHSTSALALAPEAPVVQYANALVNLHLGNEAAAIAAVELALDLGYPRALLRADPQLVAVRSSPRLAVALIAGRAMARN